MLRPAGDVPVDGETDKNCPAGVEDVPAAGGLDHLVVDAAAAEEDDPQRVAEKRKKMDSVVEEKKVELWSEEQQEEQLQEPLGRH